MSAESLVIVLPLPPRVLSPNCMVGSLCGRFAKAAAAKKYRNLAKVAVEEAVIETSPWDSVSVGAAFYYATKRRRDQDNAMSSLKSAYDGIVDSGLVVDDDYGHMSREAPQFNIDKQHPRVELTITRLQ